MVGSGIMAETLTKDVAVALLGNTLPTGAILVVLITPRPDIGRAFQSRGLARVCAEARAVAARCAIVRAAQIAGGIAGTMLAHAMFALPLLDASLKMRTGGGQWLAEFVAAFGLVATILAGFSFNGPAIPWLVGLYITAAYWFTSRPRSQIPPWPSHASLTNTFSGIRPLDLPGFVIAELCGAMVALMLMSWLLRAEGEGAAMMKEARS